MKSNIILYYTFIESVSHDNWKQGQHAFYWQLTLKRVRGMYVIAHHSIFSTVILPLIDWPYSNYQLNQWTNQHLVQLPDIVYEKTSLVTRIIWTEATDSVTVGLIFFGPVISHRAYLPHCTICQCSPHRVQEEKNIIFQQYIIKC